MSKEFEQAQEIASLFTYHAPSPRQQVRLEALREQAKNLAMAIHNLVPPGPDKSAAIRKVREAVMTANAGIVLGPEEW